VRLVDFEPGAVTGPGNLPICRAPFGMGRCGHRRRGFPGPFDLSAGERRRVRLLRRVFAAYWVMRLLPGGSSGDRNPPGTLDRQASRLLDLLG